MLYFGVEQLGTGGGIMLTASHNPAQYNGFKLCREHAIPIGEASGLKEIERLAGGVASEPPAPRRGRVERVDVRRPTSTTCSRRRRGRACASRSTAATAWPRRASPLLARLPLEVTRLYFEPDGTFPNHEADPLKLENLRDVCEAVRRTRADFGVAFDGDADRAIFVDEQAQPISSDLVTALLARGSCAGPAGACCSTCVRAASPRRRSRPPAAFRKCVGWATRS